MALPLPEETLLEMYWTMLLSRRLDERAWVLHRQGKIAFHISAIGHEAAQIGVLTLSGVAMIGLPPIIAI